MKKKFLLLAASVSICFFSLTSIAQTTAGDDGEGMVELEDDNPYVPPAPVSLKRNNGNGTCKGEAELRVAFDSIPRIVPVMDEIRYEGHTLPVVFGSIDGSQLAKKKYVSYCILSGNLPPAGKISVKLRYVQTNQIFWLILDN